MHRFRFEPYDDTVEIPNVVVDGAPNRSTVLTLTHWPGIAQPAGLEADLSAEMAFNYLDHPCEHAAAEVATNNHFDQDGLVGLHALIRPEQSLRHRDELIDVAAAGDFGTYRFRRSARVSMALWAYAQSDRSPLGAQLEVDYPSACARLYEATLPLLIPMVEDPLRFRDLWHDDDAQLSASEAALAGGLVTVEELPSLDLAIATIRSDALEGGHRFTFATSDLIHPMAINNATRCCRLLLVRGHEYLFVDRYETWVQYRSRSLPQRVDMEPLAERLTALETGATTWTAAKPSSLSPELRPSGTSSLSNTVVREAIIDHLRTAPPAWNPFTVAA